MPTWKPVAMMQMRVKPLLRGVISCAFFLGLSAPGHADAYPIGPQTKLRVSVVQWIPLKGEYQRWDAVSGDFVVSESGTISLPLVGPLMATDADSSELASRVAERIKIKTGLLTPPSATVEVLEYPPIYVVGSVMAPGAHPFRPGLRVLQALALSGGRYRSPNNGDIKGQLGMLGELKTVRDDILRAVGRIARLKAEAAGEKEIRFPNELTLTSDNELAVQIMAQEQVLFAARANALKRQIDNYSELQDLLKGEIQILGQKTEALDRNIKLVDEELTSVKSLVDRGIATVSRRSELERAVAALQSNRLDEITAAMRARQSLSETTRNGQGLRDKHYTDVSGELQNAQADLGRLKIKEDVIEKTLILGEVSAASDQQRNEREDSSIEFTIVRYVEGKSETLSATELTPLAPGDVLKVKISPGPGRSEGSAEPRPSQ